MLASYICNSSSTIGLVVAAAAAAAEARMQVEELWVEDRFRDEQYCSTSTKQCSGTDRSGGGSAGSGLGFIGLKAYRV